MKAAFFESGLAALRRAGPYLLLELLLPGGTLLALLLWLSTRLSRGRMGDVQQPSLNPMSVARMAPACGCA